VLRKDTKFSLSGKLHSSIQAFINENYENKCHTRISQVEFESLKEKATRHRQSSESQISDTEKVFELARSAAFSQKTLDGIIKGTVETFSEMLFRLIDERQEQFPKDSDVWRRANITKSTFSAIRSKPNQNPSKSTVLCLAIALELSLDVTLDLLKKASYTLDESKHDRIIEYFIREKEYDIDKLNMTLAEYGLKSLGYVSREDAKL
jgi:hypothetical protein